jgi:G:T-mismatch repair DNA endonuclease (very short patch repair protein)
MRKHQFDWGQHLCPNCSAVQAQQKMKKIRNNPEWRSKFAETVASGMSKMSPEERQQWRTNSRASLIQYYAETSEEKRRQGVVKQWQTMTQETKDARAKKIRKWSKSFWAAMTPEQRNLHVSKMIKGLSRSKISDEFRQTLVGFGLYYGFRSEQTVSGFVVDECNEELKVVIEFYGDYYHCNPRNPKFADPEYYNPTLRMKASQKWESDRRRFAAIRKKGYQVLVVWENDWRKSPATEIARVQMFLSGARKKSGSSPPSSE